MVILSSYEVFGVLFTVYCEVNLCSSVRWNMYSKTVSLMGDTGERFRATSYQQCAAWWETVNFAAHYRVMILYVRMLNTLLGSCRCFSDLFVGYQFQNGVKENCVPILKNKTGKVHSTTQLIEIYLKGDLIMNRSQQLLVHLLAQ